MAQPPMDAVGAFSYLTENIPTWIDRVSDLAVHTAAKHAEYSAAFKKLSAKGVRRPPRRRKNSSVCSIRTEDQNVLLAVRQEAASQKQSQQGQQDEAAQGLKDSAIDDTPAHDEPYDNPRKRNRDQAPWLSDDEVDFVCTRHNVVIEYDGHTQETLEDIARKIAIARNNLRRGKIASMARPSIRMGMMNRRLVSDNDGSEADPDPDALLSSIRSTRQRGAQASPSFDMAEKQLELIHSLCETAAHQVLRVGSCDTQLAAIKDKFTALLKSSRTEVERLKRQQSSLESKNATDKPTPVQSAKLGARRTSPSAERGRKSPTSDNNAIEVDDDTGESEEIIDMSAFRATRRMRS